MSVNANLAEPSVLVFRDLETVAIDEVDCRITPHNEIAMVDVSDHKPRSVDCGEGTGGICGSMDQEAPVGTRELRTTMTPFLTALAAAATET